VFADCAKRVAHQTAFVEIAISQVAVFKVLTSRVQKAISELSISIVRIGSTNAVTFTSLALSK